MFSNLTAAVANEHIRDLHTASNDARRAEFQTRARLRTRFGWSLMRLGLRIAHQLPPQTATTMHA